MKLIPNDGNFPPTWAVPALAEGCPQPLTAARWRKMV